jgi:hypothetical protein
MSQQRFQVQQSGNLTSDAYNHWHVFDWETSQVARCPCCGKLAYFPTRAEAAAFAERSKAWESK